MKIDLCTLDWNAISAIGSISAFIIIFITFLEMRKQRSYTYRPLFFIKDQLIVIQKNKNGVPIFRKETYDHIDSFHPPDFTLRLTNIGFASAHNIKIKWKFGIQHIRSAIDNYVSKSKELHKKTYKNSFDNYFFGLSIKDGYGFCLRDTDLLEDYTYISKEETVNLKIPEALLNYLSYYPYFYYKERNESRIEFDINLPINIFLEYKDLANKTRRQDFKMNIHIIMNEGFDENKENILVGEIKFN